PFGEVNFHGPKDEYFLSREWDLPFTSAVPAGQNGGHPPDVCVMRLVLRPDLLQVVIRSAAACVSLTPGELKAYRESGLPEKEINEWLYRRIVAKDAARTFWHRQHGERMFPADIAVEMDGFGRAL